MDSTGRTATGLHGGVPQDVLGQDCHCVYVKKARIYLVSGCNDTGIFSVTINLTNSTQNRSEPMTFY